MQEIKKFWMVWREGGARSRSKHDTPESARDEAERIAQRHPGMNTYVVEAISCTAAVPPPPQELRVTHTCLPSVKEQACTAGDVYTSTKEGRKMEITETICSKVLSVVDAGLCSGVGKPIPGEMCVEAAVTYALGEPFSDEPSCVSPVLRSFKISLNDKSWTSNAARAAGMRRLAIAQLGTKNTLNEKLFVEKLVQLTISTVLVKALRAAASLSSEPHKTALLEAAGLCEKNPTEESARKADAAASAANAAASAANAAAYAASAATYTANAAAYAASAATYAATAAAYAATAAAYAVRSTTDFDKFMSDFSEDVVQILIEMETPGSRFLFLTKKNKTYNG